MKFSIFTPTHNAEFLERAAKSLASQTYRDFEWIVVPNNKLRQEDIQHYIPEMRIVEYRGTTLNIGELKAFACKQCTGDVVVEFDHDDELFPECLAELKAAYESDKSPDFVYSNSAEIKDGKPFTYNNAYGWESRPFIYDGETYLETICFPASPASFSKIWFAPNHVRTWKRSFYEKIGGHDKSLKALDDQDLNARSYIHGTVHHIDKGLYKYYLYPNNSFKSKDLNKWIQENCWVIHDKYIRQLVEKWCKLNGLPMVDLGAAFGKPEGYIGVDLKNADIISDLNNRWPFEDGSVGVFRAVDIIEHLNDPIHVMSEAYRCLAPNGWFMIDVPSTDGRGAFQDPTHKTFWNSNSFWYYTKEVKSKYIDSPVSFQLNRVKNWFPTDFDKLHNIVYTHVDLLKPSGRVPAAMT